MTDDIRRDILGRRITARFSHHHNALDTWLRNGHAPGEWTADAACRAHDPELFFPIDTSRGRWPRHNPQIAQAKTICAGCLVRVECLTHALNAHETGIWGGTTETERDNLYRRTK